MQAFEAKPPPLVEGPPGAIRVLGTRVSLETLVTAFDEGATAEEIVERYPSLDLASVYAVIAYVLDHREEVAVYAARRRNEARELQNEIETRSPPAGIRDRLLARRRTASGR